MAEGAQAMGPHPATTIKTLRAKVRKRALKSLSIRHEHLDPEHVTAQLDAMEDATIVALERALFSHPQSLRAIDVRQLMFKGTTDVDYRELATFADAVSGGNSEEKLLRVRELHQYDLPQLAGVEDFSSAGEETRAICRALLVCLGRLISPSGNASAPASVFVTAPARTSARIITGIADPALLRLVADYPDRVDEIVSEVELHGTSTLGTLRERFENVAARALGEGWL